MVTGTLKTSAQEDAIDRFQTAEGQPLSLPVQLETASDPWLDTVSPGFRERLSRLGVLSLVNLALVGMLVITTAWELIEDQTAYSLVATIPAGLVFAWTARIQALPQQPSLLWLRISGGTCALFCLLSALSFYASLLQPVDIPCAISSATFGLVYAGVAWYQLRGFKA